MHPNQKFWGVPPPPPPSPRDLSVVTRKSICVFCFTRYPRRVTLVQSRPNYIIIPECLFCPSKMESETEQGATHPQSTSEAVPDNPPVKYTMQLLWMQIHLSTFKQLFIFKLLITFLLFIPHLLSFSSYVFWWICLLEKLIRRKEMLISKCIFLLMASKVY